MRELLRTPWVSVDKAVRGFHRTRLSHYNEGLLTERQCEQMDVVLVRPRNSLNIGAAARAMANFGLLRLTVVAPYEEHWRGARSAVGAPQQLAEARQVANMAEAVADCTLVIGTGSLNYRKAEQAVVVLPDLAPHLQQEFDRKGRVALIFGPENHGLTREDLSWCHLLLEIPTDARQPSMNLGQAVAVCLYEIATRVSPVAAAHVEGKKSASRSGDLDRLAEFVEETMRCAGYSPTVMQEANSHDLRLLLRRLALDEKDTRRMMGLFRRILWRMRKS